MEVGNQCDKRLVGRMLTIAVSTANLVRQRNRNKSLKIEVTEFERKTTRCVDRRVVTKCCNREFRTKF